MADLYRVKEFLRENGGIVAPGAVLEEESYVPEELEHAGETINVEPVGARPIDQTIESELRFFEDGIQRTLYVGHFVSDGFHIPVHLCTAAATILERTDRQFHLANGLFLKRDMLLVSRANVPDPATLDFLAEGGIEVVDTGIAAKNFNDLCRAAQYQSKRERLELEARLIETWDAQYTDGSFLVIDGTIMNLRSEEALKRCVGVSKHIVERYFELVNHRKIYNLKMAERSWVFRFKTKEDDPRMGARDRLSWYIRIRQSETAHPEFGLIRCELSKSHAAGATELVDSLSSSLFAERFPIAFPDARWDRLLYPIRQCEQYLRSRCRSVSSVQAEFGRTRTF